MEKLIGDLLEKNWGCGDRLSRARRKAGDPALGPGAVGAMIPPIWHGDDSSEESRGGWDQWEQGRIG